MERLLDQWDEDEEPLPEDELPEHLRPPPKVDFSQFDPSNPEAMLQATKKGKTLMTFVQVTGDATRDETEDLTKIWQTSLWNSHIQAERYLVDDNRAIFLFKDGSQAWSAKEYLIDQEKCESVTIENKKIFDCFHLAVIRFKSESLSERMKINQLSKIKSNMQFFLILVVFMTAFEEFTNGDCNNEPKCQISKVLGMKGADCYDRDIREFPKCLRSDIEIIDLTKNRIKQLRFSDLERYTYLKMLYLQDNFLLKIEDNAFDGKTDLTTLDLSNNGMTKIPLDIFHLPSLQSLYLSQNTNTNIVETMEEAKPITSPLTQFDISFSEIERLPEIGLLPTLVKYNISGNNLVELNIKHFSGLCGLKYLITNNITVNLQEPCDCWNTNRWLKSKNVIFSPFDCEMKETLCAEVPVNASDLESYEKCSKLLREITAKSMLKKILIPLLIGVVIVCVCIGFYCRRRRKLNKKALYGVPMEEEKLSTLEKHQ
ncbi:hypothetical protein HHI36_010387 [Cryptolaemus montrouzieri]|uniref:Uncharacterized protein n=1 Tax=Cryptolaemus montrouzieri TaxID=559131 RepID=A0ABD2MIM6_9CUCU